MQPSLTFPHRAAIRRRVKNIVSVAFATLMLALGVRAETPAEFTITGDWEVKVTVREPRPAEATLQIASPKVIAVAGEKIDSLPLFNSKTAVGRKAHAFAR